MGADWRREEAHDFPGEMRRRVGQKRPGDRRCGH